MKIDPSLKSLSNSKLLFPVNQSQQIFSNQYVFNLRNVKVRMMQTKKSLRAKNTKQLFKFLTIKLGYRHSNRKLHCYCTVQLINFYVISGLHLIPNYICKTKE